MGDKILVETSAAQVYTTNNTTVEDELNNLNEKKLPSYSDSDESKILSILDGTPSWVSNGYQIYRVGTDDPSDDLGNESDLYLKLEVE